MSVATSKILRAWTYLGKFGNKLIEDGPKSTVAYSYHWLMGKYADWDFDRRHNVNTFESVPLANLTIVDNSFNHRLDKRRYEQTSVVIFRSVISTLPIKHDEYVFVDFGSGKGKVLFMASEYNFKKIVGVEFAEELHRIAKKNLLAYSNVKQYCYDIELVLGDAADLDIPQGKSVFYMFNAFRGAEHILAKIIDNICVSFHANPRPMYFIYVNPVSQHLFDGIEFLRLKEKRNFRSLDVAIYETSFGYLDKARVQTRSKNSAW